MGVRLLFLNVIYQIIITASLGGVILPFSDCIEKVTPIKPKPLAASTVISPITPSPSPIYDSKDDPKLFSSAAKGSISRDFSSPLLITSSSRPLPVPKIDSTSIENVKIPEKLKEKFLARSKSPVKYTKPDICTPEASLPNKNLFSSSPSKLPNTLLTYSPLEIHKLSPLPSITSLPKSAVESLKTNDIGGSGTLPFSNTIGKVTPIKPKPLPVSTVTSSLPPVCDSKDDPIFFLPSVKGLSSREFSLPIAITSSSRPLPVPKINSTSIENVKMPERLKEKFLAKYKTPVRYPKPDICSPDLSLSNRKSFSSSPSNSPDALRAYSPLEISPLPSVTPLPNSAVESLITNGIGGSGTLPFSDTIGKVTPIKPKPLPVSTVTTSSSPVCDSKDNPIFFLPAAKRPSSREFSLPLAITSSSRPLPVLKIDSASIENVKMPEKLSEKCLAQSKIPFSYTKPDMILPEVSLSSITSSPSPTYHSRDSPIVLSPAAKEPIFGEFSSPLILTSSSRALPVPKIDSTSIENVKIPEKLRAKSLARSNSPVKNIKPGIRSPGISLPNKNPFSSSPSKLPNTLPNYSPLDVDKLSQLPSVTSLPDLAAKSSKTSDIHFLSSSSKTSPYSPLGGVTHSCSDSIGQVIPTKPKPLTASNISPSITSPPSPIYHSIDNPICFPPSAKGPLFGEFSSPLVLTTLSRALPVPKIDSTSIENVKIPENLKEKLLARSKSPVKYTKPLPNKYPVSPSPTKLPDALQTYSPLKIHKLSPLPSITSLPDSAIESSKTSCMDLLSHSSDTSQYSLLPFSDTIGKATPMKSRPLPASITSLSPPICHNKDNPISSSPSAKTPISRGFSSPIAVTSSSRVLPVPKIDSSSIENVKMPERLRRTFLAQSGNPNVKPNIHSPKVSLAKNYPFLLPSSNPSINNFSPLPSIELLHDASAESLISSGNDLLSSSSKSCQISAPVRVPLSLRSIVCESPSTLEARKPAFCEHLTENTFSPLSSSLSMPCPLSYKSRYLPEVKTPSAPLSYRPFFYKGASNVDLPSHSCSHNLVNPPTLTSSNSQNLLSRINEPYASSYLNSIKTLQIPKPINCIQLPKPLTNIPISSLAQDSVTKNVWPLKEVNTVLASAAIEPKNLRDDRADFKLKPCSPLKIKPVQFTTPTNYFNSLATPLVPISISSPNVDLLSKKMSCFNCSKSMTPEIFPVIGICTETIENMDVNNLGNYQTSFDLNNVRSLELVNLPCPSLYQYPSFTKEYISQPFKYSPPIIPKETIPTIFSSTASFSPIAYGPSTITQTPPTPVSYINQSATSSIAEITSNMASSITNLLSNITQNILLSVKPSIHSAPQNKRLTPTYLIQSNSYDDTLLKSEQSTPECDPVMSISLLPIIRVPVDDKKAQTSDPSTIVSLDTPLTRKVSPIQPLFDITSPQLTAPVLSPTSLKTFSKAPLCPSCLPSPILPLYPEISSPFHIEAPTYQASLSKKDCDAENSIDLMLLTEILNNDESFDWDDLDALLAFLSLN